jgi:competence protein CoiA
LGWSVIWILHDHFYNQFRLKAAEQVLRFFPHYFTNVNQVGEGVVYDQFDLINQGLRIDKMSPLPIDFSHVQTRESFQLSTNSLVLLTQRLDKWSHFFMGDLMSLDEDHSHFYYQTAKEKERIFLESNKNKKWTFMVLLRLAIYKFMIRPYRFVFQLLLEKICH